MEADPGTRMDNDRLRGEAVKLTDGTQLHVESYGEEQPALIMLHGGPGGDSTPFKQIAQNLSTDMQVLIYDHRGMGKSGRSTPDKWNLQQWAEDLGELIADKQLNRPIVMGQSFGGFVALTYAIQNSSGLSGLILSSTAARAGRAEAIKAFEAQGGKPAAAAAASFFDNPTPESWHSYNQACAHLYNQKPRGLMKLDQEMLLHFQQGERADWNLSSQLNAISCPTWIVTGQNDPITPPQLSEEMAELLGGTSTLTIAEQAGHGIYRDQPELFYKLLKEFRRNCLK